MWTVYLNSNTCTDILSSVSSVLSCDVLDVNYFDRSRQTRYFRISPAPITILQAGNAALEECKANLKFLL